MQLTEVVVLELLHGPQTSVVLEEVRVDLDTAEGLADRVSVSLLVFLSLDVRGEARRVLFPEILLQSELPQ